VNFHACGSEEHRDDALINITGCRLSLLSDLIVVESENIKTKEIINQTSLVAPLVVGHALKS